MKNRCPGNEVGSHLTDLDQIQYSMAMSNDKLGFFDLFLSYKEFIVIYCT